MSERSPVRENVPGDFYVEDGCCTSCEVLSTEAPDLFAYTIDGRGTCFVCNQPSSPEEVDRMINAFQVQEMGCLRYKGRDRVVQVRLVDLREGDQCDHLPPDLRSRRGTGARGGPRRS